MAAIFVTTVVIGMIARTIPQINVLQVGLTSNLVVMLLAVFLTVSGCVWLFMNDIQISIQLIQDSIRDATSN